MKQFRPRNIENLECFEYDEPSIDVNAIFENDGYDKNGVQYSINSSLTYYSEEIFAYLYKINVFNVYRL